jgi:hypothetical protein
MRTAPDGLLRGFLGLTGAVPDDAGAECATPAYPTSRPTIAQAGDGGLDVAGDGVGSNAIGQLNSA